MPLERLTDVVTYHGEGPVWSDRWGGLRFVDMLAGDVLSLWPDGSVDRIPTGSPVAAAIRPRENGGMVIGILRSFALQDPDGTITPLTDLWTTDQLRMNEGGCDPNGRFYCGSMSADRGPTAGLWRLDPDHTITQVLDGVSVSNGLEWSPRGDIAYYNDTQTYTISAFAYDGDQGLHNRRVFVDLRADDVRPDGLTVDSEGGVWIGTSNAGAVRRYSPEGALDELIELPCTKVTACTFGGDGLAQLFITTSREGLADDEEPEAGSLFMIEPGITGLPVREFEG